MVVAAGGDEPDMNTLRAFISNGRQGVNYHRNVWHHPLFAWQTETDFNRRSRRKRQLRCRKDPDRGAELCVRLHVTLSIILHNMWALTHYLCSGFEPEIIEV